MDILGTEPQDLHSLHVVTVLGELYTQSHSLSGAVAFPYAKV